MGDGRDSQALRTGQDVVSDAQSGWLRRQRTAAEKKAASRARIEPD